MAFSDGEKLIIAMMADLHRHLGVEDSVELDFVQKAISYGDTWALKSKYPGIFSDTKERNPADVQFVHDALTMWSILERSYEELSDEDKEKVRNAPGSHGHAPRFEGFDGHSDLVSIARTMIEDLEYYEEFEGRALDAHMPINEVHERLVAAFKPLREQLHFGLLSADAIISVIDNRIHPENRA